MEPWLTGDLILCAVTVTDPDGAFVSDSGDVTVANTLPSLVSVVINPASPMVTDTVDCGGMVSDSDSVGTPLALIGSWVTFLWARASA